MKLAVLADLWGLQSITAGSAPALTGVPVTVRETTVRLPGLDIDMADSGSSTDVAEWLGVLHHRGVLFLILTSVPLTAPDWDTAMDAALGRPAQTWYGLTPVADAG